MKFYQKHSRLVAVLTFAFFVLVGACNFPTLTLIIVFVGLSLYTSLGTAEAAMLPHYGIQHILPLNLLLVLLGMGARYLLEFGEVSNSYNFTVPNMLLHIGVTVTLSTLSWLWTKTVRGKNAKGEA